MHRKMDIIIYSYILMYQINPFSQNEKKIHLLKIISNIHLKIIFGALFFFWQMVLTKPTSPFVI